MISRNERKEIREAKEDLKDGYINIDLWKRMLEREKVDLQGQIYKLRQRLNELSAERDRLENLKYPEMP